MSRLSQLRGGVDQWLNNLVPPPLEYHGFHKDLHDNLIGSLTIEHRDPEGELKEVQHIPKTNTLTRAFARLVVANFINTRTDFVPGNTVVDTGGNARTMGYYGAAWIHRMVMDAPAGNDDYGILLGSSSTAMALDDYYVGTRITHGNGGGNLEYGTSNVGSPTANASTAYMEFYREFTNNSGGSVSIEEMCLICLHTDTGYTSRRFLLERTLISTSIADSASATFRFRVSD